MEDIQVFTEQQVKELQKRLDQRLVSNRKGGGNTTLKYIEGHDAIDQANRLFGYGNWAYRPLSCEQSVLLDPLTSEAVGIAYKAQVELIVRGCVAPIVEVGSQPVATWNVDDQIMKVRMAAAKYNKKPVDESPFTPAEKSKARGVITDAHEMAEKGAVTDALKRALRTFGDQFGNGLYGDGRVMFDEDEDVEPRTQQGQSQGQAPRTGNSQRLNNNGIHTPAPQGQQGQINPSSAATEQQITSIKKLCQHLEKPEPDNLSNMTFVNAKQLLQELTEEYRAQKQKGNTSVPTSSISAPTPSKLRKRCDEVFGSNKWDALMSRVLNAVVPDDNLTPEDCNALKQAMDNAERNRQQPQQKQSA